MLVWKKIIIPGKIIKPIPHWYDEYLNEIKQKSIDSKKKQNAISYDHDSLDAFFNPHKYKNKNNLNNLDKKEGNKNMSNNNKLYNKNGFDATNYTPAQRQAYHNDCAKRGSTFYNTETGEMTLRSDFNRGYHKAKADVIGEKRGQAAYKHKQNGTYVPTKK